MLPRLAPKPCHQPSCPRRPGIATGGRITAPATPRNTHPLHGSFPHALQLPDLRPQLLAGQPARAVAHPPHSEVTWRTAPGVPRGPSRGDEELVEAEVEEHVHKDHGEQQPHALGDVSVGETIPGSMLLSHGRPYNRTGDTRVASAIVFFDFHAGALTPLAGWRRPHPLVGSVSFSVACRLV